MEKTDPLSSRRLEYLRKATPNRLAPKDEPPMQVVEFSLTNEARDKLQQALKPYVYGKRKKPEDFGKIVEENLPHEIVDELRHYVKTKGLSTVYIIRNLGEIQPEEVDASIDASGKKRWARARIYMMDIAQALSAALKLEDYPEERHFTIKRFHDERPIFGSGLHRDLEDITMLSGVLSDGAKTRFTDRRVLSQHPGEWQKSPLLPDCSQDVLIDHGALALWVNDGDILHQALKAPPDALSRAQENALLRIVVRTSMNRPQQAL